VVRVAVAGASGYMGAELLRLLLVHPRVSITGVTSDRLAGEPLARAYPHLRGLTELSFHDLDAEWLAEVADLAFLALPHMESQRVVPVLRRRGVKAIDLSADYRLRDPNDYVTWYKAPHTDPAGLAEAVYGLPELHRKAIAGASLVASPGCYPAGAVLATAPLLKRGLAKLDGIVIDGKSGVSGAGRSLSLTTHFSEVNENTMAYSVEGHRHLPENIQELANLAAEAPSITFLTHLVPMTRGILSSCYARLRPDRGWDGTEASTRVRDLYRDFYAGNPFVHVTANPPQTKQTLGNNLCLVYPTVDRRTGRLIVISCLDNLVKGAAGQAVQNMNLMCGYPEGMSLEALAVYP